MKISADFEDLKEVRAALDAAGDGLSRALAEGITTDAQPLLVTTKALTPYGPGPDLNAKRDPETGELPDTALPHIRDMLAVTVQGGTIALISTHPGAVVHEFGGTISPKGHPIVFKEQAMARRAAVRQLPHIEEAVERRIEGLL